MRQKIIAIGLGLTLASIAAVGVFASNDGVSIQADPTVTETRTPVDATPTDTPDATTPDASATATETPDTTSTPTSTPDASETPVSSETATPTPGDVTSTPEPSETSTPDASATPGDDDDEDETHGIPEGNPAHHDDDGDGVCEKHETAIKTTPSGNQVRVPCQAADGGSHGSSENKGHGHGHNDDGE